MNNDFGLNLEAARNRGKRFDESARQNLVSGKHIAEVPPEDSLNDIAEKPVSDAVTESIRVNNRVEASSIDEIEVFLEERNDERGRDRSIICVVSVDENVDVGINIGEHPPYDISFALAPLSLDESSSILGARVGVISRIVVVDIYVCCWK